MDKKDIFPQIKKGIEDFMQEEEGNISRSKVAMIGSMMVILGVMLADSDVYAAHSSHRSSTHGSHASHSSSSHSSHGSHSNHNSHSSGSHSSGSNTTATVKLPKMQTPQSTPSMQ